MEARIKGAAFREFLRFYATTRGETELVRRASAVAPEARGHFDLDAAVLGVVASSWYPALAVHALLDELTRGLSPVAVQALARDGSLAVMRATLRGIYKVLFDWMATPARYAKYAPRLWNAYYDTGVLSVLTERATSTASGAATSIVRDWSGHHPFICELNRGAAAAIYGAMVCRDATCERTQCVSRGDAHCTFVTRWSA